MTVKKLLDAAKAITRAYPSFETYQRLAHELDVAIIAVEAEEGRPAAPKFCPKCFVCTLRPDGTCAHCDGTAGNRPVSK